MNKAKKVTINKITISIEEETVFNHEGDEPTRKAKTLAKTTQPVGVKMPEAGYFTNLGLVFPAKDLRDSDGVVPRGKREFPTYATNGFTTTGTLYKIEYYLTIKVMSPPFSPHNSCLQIQAQLSNARDITLKQPIVVCPFDHASCREEMEAIEQAAKDAANVSVENPMLPAQVVGGERKVLIE